MQCKALARDGSQCRNNAIAGLQYCYIASHGAVTKPAKQRILNYLVNHKTQGVVGLIALVFGVGVFVWGLLERPRTATSGRITSARAGQTNTFNVGVVRFRTGDGVFLRDGAERLLDVRAESGRLLVSANIVENGQLIAELKDNEWNVQPRPAIFDRNYTADVLEVRGRGGEVILQVANLGYTVHVAGVFGCKNGKRFALGPAGYKGAVISPMLPNAPSEIEITPICQYPSDRHFGICSGTEKLRRLIPDGKPSYYLSTGLDICSEKRSMR